LSEIANPGASVGRFADQASQAFATAKQNSQNAKEKFRGYLRKKSSELRDVQNLDVIMNQDGKTLTVFETRERVRKPRGGNVIELE